MFGPADLLILPIVLLSSLATLPFTLLALPFTQNAADLRSWHALKQVWFQHWWGWFAPSSKRLWVHSVGPLLSQARGTILEIGSGNGIWLDQLTKGLAEGKIEKIYAVEPNELFHSKLNARADDAGLGKVFVPIKAMAHELQTAGIKKGSVDTIITVHVLCSLGPQAESILRTLYEYLKPGGQWLVFEHVVSKHAAARAMQGRYIHLVHLASLIGSVAMINPLWYQAVDGCDLMKDTESILRRAGDWETIALGPDPWEGDFECIPHVVGRLVKKL